MTLSPRAKEQLALQQKKYLASLPAKRARILSYWQSIQLSGWNHACLNELRTEVHRLSGSAGSYGLAALGNAAGKLDRRLSTENEKSALSASITELTDSLLDEFDQAINHHSTTANML